MRRSAGARAEVYSGNCFCCRFFFVLFFFSEWLIGVDQLRQATSANLQRSHTAGSDCEVSGLIISVSSLSFFFASLVLYFTPNINA